MKFQAGKLYTFSEGEYSDYDHLGTFEALVDVSQDEVDDLVREVQATPSDDIYSTHNMFLTAVQQKGWFKEVDTHEVHLGGYRELCLTGA